MRLLLIEDEKALSEALAYILKKNRYGVDTALDGITGFELAEIGIYDLIILDWMLPGKDGLALLKELRSRGVKTPVLFLTARDTVKNRVEGLDAGADDYLVKPFSTEELLARIRALGRRQAEQFQDEKIQVGNLVLDLKQGLAVCGDENIRLTLKELQLLELFARNKGQVLSKEQILDRIWGLNSDVEMNNVEIYIYYLRRKLDPGKCGFNIDTIRGIGYSLKEVGNVSRS